MENKGNFFERFRNLKQKAQHAKEDVVTVAAPSALAVVGVAAFLGIGYLAASQMTGEPDYGVTYDNIQPLKGTAGYGSKIVAVTAAMLRDEQARGWCPSETFLTPSSWRVDTCNYQLGKEVVISRVAYTLREDIASERSLSPIDPDLDVAVQRIQAGPYLWGPFFNTNHNYALAVQHLDAYNTRVANGGAIFSPRIDNLAELLKSLIHATSGQVASLDSVQNPGIFLTGDNRAKFSEMKGSFAAACEILKAAALPLETSPSQVKGDFANVIDKQSATDSFGVAIKEVCAVNQIGTPLISPFLTGTVKSLQGQGEIAVAKLVDAYSTLAAGQGNAPN
jgi:hypothetical protein